MSLSIGRAHLELLLVRHGSVREGEHRLWGRTTVGLNDEGRQQAAMLSDELKGVSFEALYTSPRDRALETATAIVAPHGFAAVIDHAFVARLPIETGSISIVACLDQGSRVTAVSTRHIPT